MSFNGLVSAKPGVTARGRRVARLLAECLTKLAPAARVGRYQLVSAIGAGGMGEVYRARDTRLARDVAIKVLPDVLSRDRERVARFEREGRALGDGAQ